MSSLIKIKNFYSAAAQMRRYYEQVFSSPNQMSSERYVWDYFHVPSQYKFLKTPAWEFFPRELYRKLHENLVWWGRENLGCHDISPPWLSCYVDGCEQKLHMDKPHGPWAFVFSLCPKKIAFKGGDTLLLREEIIDLNKNLNRLKSFEESSVFESHRPDFNQLLLFDPRIPHGVRRVEGAESVLEGRLVIHGWFVNPRPFIQGPLNKREISVLIQGLLQSLESLGLSATLSGYVSFRFQVTKGGDIKYLTQIASSLRSHVEGEASHLASFLKNEIKKYKIKKSPQENSWVTLPFIFDA